MIIGESEGEHEGCREFEEREKYRIGKKQIY